MVAAADRNISARIATGSEIASGRSSADETASGPKLAAKAPLPHRNLPFGRGKVLVFGDDTRSFLATVRSLARHGLEVHAVPFNYRTPALTSRYIRYVHWLPYYLGDGAEWLQAIRDLLQAEGFDLVIPCDERALIPLQTHRDELSELARLAMPDDLAIEILFDKNKTRELARSVDVSIPAGRLIRAEDTAEGIIAEAGLPVAIKPCQSYSADGMYSRQKVEIATTKEGLAKILARSRDGSHFFEAFFEGQGVGLSVLASEGKLLQVFEHHRVHEESGSSYYRVSAVPSGALTNAVEKMVAKIRYTGIAMIEFRVNKVSGAWVLLEVNARPWGSLPLPVALGVDFPYRWYKLLVAGEETPERPYKTGVYGRNFIPDLIQTSAKAWELRHRPAQLARFCGAAVGEYSRVFRGREVGDVLTFDDPKPAVCEVVSYTCEASRRLASAFPGADRSVRQRDRRALSRAIRRRKREGVTIVFVCQGNICRSPVAERLLQHYLAAESHRVRVVSAGMLPRIGVLSPAAAVEAATAFNVDLKNHRSLHFSKKMADGATAIVIFDEINLARIMDRYPSITAPIVSLGNFVREPKWPLHIADPDGGDLAKFRETYEHIDEGVRGLAHVIRTTLDQ
jgi:protein-tyrosine-phosphatase/predicted ATP-grasp superfamily ATP-dependent carboligase